MYQGNRGLQITRNLMDKFPEVQTNKRGILVDGKLIFA